MIKRKRLDARTFREWHVAQAKKHRLNSEAKSQHSNEEATLERRGSSVLEGVEHAYSSTNVKLHETTGEMVENGYIGAKEVHSVNQEKILSHLESGSEGTSKDEMLGESNYTLLKSQGLSDCQSSSSRFLEYWVPVGLSHLQLEKYCEVLITNSMLLCSSSKRETVSVLHDVLTISKMCCDHPYLVDQSLQRYVVRGCPTNGYLSTGIEASRKLFMLDKILTEAKEKKLRVVIVFQSNCSNSQSIHLRHILDDYIRQKFGAEFYVHMYKEFGKKKKWAELEIFNNKESGRFVILIDRSSCQPSIKLSSVDFVILFNSDWNPINDLRSLQKMSVQSRYDHLKVFRLYSSNTLEEKVLNLAKEGIVLDSNLRTFSCNVCHMLLLWGAAYVFQKLDFFHSSSLADIKSSSEPKLESEVLDELSTILFCQDNNSSCSLISKVPKVSEAFENYSSSMSFSENFGEKFASSMDEDVPQHTIWNSLLEGRNPQWKLLPGPSQKRRRGEMLGSSSRNPERDLNSHLTMSNKALPSRVDSCLHASSGKACSPACGQEAAGKVNDHPNSDGGMGNVEETCNRRMRELLIEQKKEICEFYKTKRQGRAKLEEENLLELDLIRQKVEEPAVKLEELNKLDHSFNEKIEKHNQQMEMKRKELGNLQRASRIKEKQLRDRSLTLSKIKNLKEPISSLLDAPLLDCELELKNPIYLTPVISNSSELSESRHPTGIEQALMDGSSLDGDPGLPSDQSLTETEILEVESDGENEAVSMPRAAVSDTDHNDLVHVSENTASRSASHCEIKSEDLQFTLERKVEGDGSTNMEPSEETLCRVRGAHPDLLPMGSVTRSLESDGENNVTVLGSGDAHETSPEPFNAESNLCTSNGNHLLSSDEPLSNLPNTEMHEGEVEAPIRALNGGTEIAGANLVQTAMGGKSIENMADMPSTRLGRSISGAQPQTCTTSVNPSPIVERVTDNAQPDCDFGVSPDICPMGSASSSLESDSENNQVVLLTGEAVVTGVESIHNVSNLCTLNEPQQCALSRNICLESSSNLPDREVLCGAYNMESLTAETQDRGGSDLGTTSAVATQQHIEYVPSSRLARTSCPLLQPQTCTISGNLSLLEQPVTSANLPCNQIRQSTGTITIPNCQNTEVHSLIQPDQRQASLVNSGSCGQPVLQPTTITSSALLSNIVHQQPHISNAGGATISQPANRYSQETLILSANISPSSDPLQNELVRMQVEAAEAIKFYENKMMHLKSSRDKEIEEVHKKYGLLIQETENVLLLKKEELESHYAKVSAHKLLANTMKGHFQKRVPSEMTQELWTALHQLLVLQHHMPEQRVPLSPEPTAPPVQVVNQLSELKSVHPRRPQHSSALHLTGNPVVGYEERAPAPHLCSSRPMTPLPISNFSAPFYRMPNQQRVSAPRPLPGLHPSNCAPVFRPQLRGTRENPVLL